MYKQLFLFLYFLSPSSLAEADHPNSQFRYSLRYEETASLAGEQLVRFFGDWKGKAVLFRMAQMQNGEVRYTILNK